LVAGRSQAERLAALLAQSTSAIFASAATRLLPLGVLASGSVLTLTFLNCVVASSGGQRLLNHFLRALQATLFGNDGGTCS